jgi:hypothetical protein
MLCFQAYLSLPEGTASVVGLIAMMTDHYSVLVRLDFNFNTQLYTVIWILLFGILMPLLLQLILPLIICILHFCCFILFTSTSRGKETIHFVMKN